MKRKWIAVLLACCMLAALLLTGCSAAETVKRLRFGVAGEGGVYHNFGEQFAALENETSNGTIELRTTAGSAANLRLLTGEYLQLAIAQADLAQDAYNQTGIFAEEEDIRGFGAVAALYTEACQVIVRADSDIQSIEDLQGKTVSIGAEESGSEQNALQILSAYGLNDRLVDTINLNYTDAADQLKAGKIDAIVITVGIPSPVVTELAGECGIRLLNVDGTAAQRLLSSYNAYREVTIPAGTYPGQDADVQTVGVKAVLLASDSLPAKQVQQLTELLFSSREALEKQLGREPTMDEIAQAAGLARREVTAALESVVEPISLEEPVYTDGGDAMYVIDQVRDPDGEDSWISGLQFRQTVAGLTPREKRIMELRYLQGKTQMEVAREIGISQAQVSRLEKGALSQFRTRD